MGKQREVVTNKRSTTGNIADFRFFASVDTASWKLPGHCPNGAIERMELNVHRLGGWIQISAAEAYEAKSGRWKEKQVMLCLHHDEAIALRDFLNANIPESVEKKGAA